MLVHAHGEGLVALSEGADIAAHPRGTPPLHRELAFHCINKNIFALTEKKYQTSYTKAEILLSFHSSDVINLKISFSHRYVYTTELSRLRIFMTR